MASLRVLFVKSALNWPGASGHDVHTLQTARALVELGHDVHLATRQPLAAQALAALGGVTPHSLVGVQPAPLPRTPTRLQERFRGYWGVELHWLSRAADLISRLSPDAVVVVGLDALPYLLAVPDDIIGVWYAADEWVRHHLSLIEARNMATWPHAKAAAIKGLYERAYAPLVDVAWVVSEEERRATQRWAGMAADIIPNGVDAASFRPSDCPTVPNTAVFWGTLDFEPNLQALAWFLDEVWPTIVATRPTAQFTIMGLRPTPAAVRMGQSPRTELIADAPDVRPLATQRQIAVLPFVSGGGIKNKLLEAAALGLPIVVTPKGTEGLVDLAGSGLEIHGKAEEFAAAVLRLWDDDVLRSRAGSRNRDWVLANHTWGVAGSLACASLARLRDARG